MARLDAEAEAAVVRPSRLPTAAEARAWLESLPDLWAMTSDAGRHAVAEAVFERIDVLGAEDFTFTLTAHAKAHGWGCSLRGWGPINLDWSVWSGREALPRDHRPSHHDAARRAARALRLAAERMTRLRSRHPAGRATNREVAVVAAVLEAGSEKAAAHRLGLSHSTVKHHLASARSKVGATTTAQLVWILAPRLPGPESGAETDEQAGLDG
jgi:DNA-binding CsgD family transcriptional regulator